MSVRIIKEALAGKSGIESLTMQNEDGGAIAVFRWAGGKEVRLPGSMKTPQIIESLKSA